MARGMNDSIGFFTATAACDLVPKQKSSHEHKHLYGQLADDSAACRRCLMLDGGNKQRKGWTATMIAARFNCGDAIRRLLAAGADKDASYTLQGTTWTALSIAAAAHSCEAVAVLLRHGASPACACLTIAEHISDSARSKPLMHLAASNQPPDMCACGRASSCRLCSMAPGLRCVSIDAQRASSPYVVTGLLQELQRAGMLIDEADHAGNTALHAAVCAGNEDTMLALLRQGAQVSASSAAAGATLAAAVHRCTGNHTILHTLLQWDNLQRALSPAAISCAMRAAVEHGCGGCVAALCALDASAASRVCSLYRRPIAHAAAHGDASMDALTALLAMGATTEGMPGETPALWHAVRAGSLADVDALLIAGARADVRASVRSGCTPLMLAAANSSTALVARLLSAEHNAIDVQDAHGCTALMHAARAGHADVIFTFIEHGADCTLTDAAGMTACSCYKHYCDKLQWWQQLAKQQQLAACCDTCDLPDTEPRCSDTTQQHQSGSPARVTSLQDVPRADKHSRIAHPATKPVTAAERVVAEAMAAAVASSDRTRNGAAQVWRKGKLEQRIADIEGVLEVLQGLMNLQRSRSASCFDVPPDRATSISAPPKEHIRNGRIGAILPLTTAATQRASAPSLRLSGCTLAMSLRKCFSVATSFA